jgi:hypothetical protein
MLELDSDVSLIVALVMFDNEIVSLLILVKFTSIAVMIPNFSLILEVLLKKQSLDQR